MKKFSSKRYSYAGLFESDEVNSDGSVIVTGVGVWVGDLQYDCMETARSSLVREEKRKKSTDEWLMVNKVYAYQCKSRCIWQLQTA